MANQRRGKRKCRYAASCFECPLDDCRIDGSGINDILSTELYIELVEGRNEKEAAGAGTPTTSGGQ